MSDRELLELAAKAAGVDGWWSGEDYCYGYNGNRNVPVPWRPLTDDGDALRLAVALGIRCEPMAAYCVAYAGSVCAQQFSEASAGDRNQAMRRAIVRAAAAIGKAMP